MTQEANCRGCRGTVRLSPGEVERIVAQTLGDQAVALVDDETCERRLAVCAACPDLRYRTTCRHCGCLVEVRARIAEKVCPAPEPRW